ncbi:MAG: AsnC family transcriptional regulator, partial [Candidatus Marsarchaeota archaeon]|nr:AsnC family transcriptional regulator [Candidatus Marsarchaeota archaeon]
MEVPKKIQEIFEQLRIEHEEPLTLKYIWGGYYVYSYYKVHDPKIDKNVIKTYYVGKINKSGVFVAALSRKLETLQLSKETIGALEAISTLSKTDSMILRCLSMNNKMERKKIAELVGLSEVTVANRIEKLNRSFDIKYTAQVNLKKLGFLRYIAFIKFEDKIPKIDEIKEAFENDQRVLLVAMLKGKYDMMVYFTIENDM